MARTAQLVRLLLTVVMTLWVAASSFSQPQYVEAGSPWPQLSRQERPWAYWWWMGSAVDQANLTRELTRYQEAGYGGVHIIPIYGAKGWESNYVSYLSPKWMELLDYTVREAHRLDLGVDMTTGTGWCFGGGPYVGEREGNASVVVKIFDLAGGQALTNVFDPKQTQALVAYPIDGLSIDLTGKIRADGTVLWAAPEGGVKLYAVSQKLVSQKVKRAAPGGEGPMLNLVYPEAMPVFLRRFTEAFDKYRGGKPRAQYHDSYEYKSEWAPNFFKEFETRRGYKLQTELPAMFSETNERTTRVLCDYRQTVSDIMVEESLPEWVDWSHRRGFITRNEAHGSPGNLLDLYALADVPETEMFRLDRNKLISKFASSAAHVAGHNLVSAETGTWLKEHFTETLGDMKYLVDDLFLSGVNHVFYHGTCYSPDEAAWPGWVFYASYEMNPRNAIWHDARALNDYVARCQSILQSGQPDNDVLVYWPIADFWQKAPPKPLLPHLTIHARGWFESQPIGQVAEELWRLGYAFDYASDRQLHEARVRDGQIKLPGGNYRAIVVPPCDFIPVRTMGQLRSLAKAGATIVFAEHLPKDVPGLARLDKRREDLTKWTTEMRNAKDGRIGRGQVLIGKLNAAMANSGVPRESLVDHAGLGYVRRKHADGVDYFLANRGEKSIDGWVSLAVGAKSAVIMDPMNGQYGVATLRTLPGQTLVYLQLPPGQSLILRTSNRSTGGKRWLYYLPAGSTRPLAGEWHVSFLSGGPELPPATNTPALGSWTKLDGEAGVSFAGTARYTLTFDARNLANRLAWLDLGQVEQSARVKLNGRDYGVVFTAPYRVRVENLQSSSNRLEIEVTSTSANRIRDLDRRGVKWQIFHDINFVNQDYRPFNAANWPVADCGLLGPVTLSLAQVLNPREVSP